MILISSQKQFFEELKKLRNELEKDLFFSNYPPTEKDVEEASKRKSEYENRLVFAISEDKKGKRITHYKRVITGENYYFFKDNKYCNINNSELIEEELKFIRFATSMDM